MGTTQLIGLSLGLLQLQSIQDALCYIVVSDRLLFGHTVIVDGNELVPGEVDLATDYGCEMVVKTKDWAGTHDRYVRECLFDHFFTFLLGAEIQRFRIGLSSCS